MGREGGKVSRVLPGLGSSGSFLIPLDCFLLWMMADLLAGTLPLSHLKAANWGSDIGLMEYDCI